jgi:hypothetical protein
LIPTATEYTLPSPEKFDPRDADGGAMSLQSVQTSVTIVWDDSVVIVFQFTDNANVQRTCAGVQIQAQFGSNTQVSQILQTTQQAGIQIANDPQTWVETVKNAHRNSNTRLAIAFDDSISANYTPPGNPAQTFQLQLLYSLAG